MKAGELYKVKSTPITRKYGVRTHGTWQAKGDDRAWPGESAFVVKSEWVASNGDAMSCLKLEFSRGRSIGVDTMSDDDKADFIKIRQKRSSTSEVL